MPEFLVRFLIGGAMVSVFSLLGDLFKPKSFAGLFGAAPSVALASLALAFSGHGAGYASLEGRSMILGAGGLAAYSFLTTRVLMKRRWHALRASVVLIPVWFSFSLGLWWILLGGWSR